MSTKVGSVDKRPTHNAIHKVMSSIHAADVRVLLIDNL